jgi:hypothetical protein
MLIDPTHTPDESWDTDPTHDRTMLALQYLTALVAVAAAGLLGFIH